MKKLFTIIIIMLLSLSLFACGEDSECTEHSDADGDSLCDRCGATAGNGGTDGEGITLFRDGEPTFQIVKGYDLTGDAIMAISKLKDRLERDFSISVDVVNDEAGNERECEVLIGTVRSRGEKYEYDRYSLGAEGYAISALDSKIIVSAGSDDGLLNTLKLFISDVLGVTDDAEGISTVTFTEDMIKVQDDYRIKDVTVGGKSIRGYKIIVDSAAGGGKFDVLLDIAARELQDFFYEKVGIRLDIASTAQYEGDAIILRSTEVGRSGKTGFRARRDGNSLVIECAHHNRFEDAFESYFSKTYLFARDDMLRLENYESDDITTVYYDDFGAVGDGRTDDYAAIFAAHTFANDGGQTVKANGAKSYLLRDVMSPIPVETSTDFSGAKIIIDSRHITRENDSTIFMIQSHVKSDYVPKAKRDEINAAKDADGLVLRGLESGEPTSKLPFSFGYPALVYIKNENNYNYIRYGYVDNIGAAQNEVVQIDAEGNIDPSTPLLHDFTEITSAVAYRSDIATLRFEDVNIVTLPSLMNLYTSGAYAYINRNICVTRANVVIDKFIHTIEGEYDKGTPVYEDENGLSQIASGYTYRDGKIYDSTGKAYSGNNIKPFMGYNYSGILRTLYANNVRVTNSVFRARKNYYGGTYDISATYTNGLVFEDCVQSNFFETDDDGNETSIVNLSECWGIAGTNYCKNMEYIRTRFNRYDAHAGVVNGKIIDSEIGVLRLIGGGDFLVEGTKIHARSSSPIQLREDYGSSFNGTLTIRDTEFIDCWDSKVTIKSLINAHKSNMDTNYACFFPNIIIDNVKVDTVNPTVTLVAANYSVYNQSTNHYPTRNIITEAVHDPDALFDYYYETKDPSHFDDDPYFSRYLDKLVTVDNNNGTYTLIFHDIPNQAVYIPPAFIEVKNNENNGYQLTLYNSSFFESTEIRASGNNLTRVD